MSHCPTCPRCGIGEEVIGNLEYKNGYSLELECVDPDCNHRWTRTVIEEN